MNINKIKNKLNFSILDSFSECIWVLDRCGNIAYINKTLREHSCKSCILHSEMKEGYNYLNLCEESLGYSINAKNVFEGTKRVLDGNSKEYYFEYACKSDKLKKWYAIKIVLLSGTEDYFLVTHSNITNIIMLQQENKKYKEKYTYFFKNNSSIILVVDEETGRILDANKAASDFYGYTIKSIQNKSVLKLMVSDNVKDFFRLGNFEQSHKLSNGTLVDVEIDNTRIPYGNKNAYYCIIHDITKRKMVRRYLRDNQEKYNKLVELSPDAIFILDEQKFVFANASALKMIGVSSIYELLNVKVNDILDFTLPDNNKLSKLIKEVITKGKTIDICERKIIKLTGESIYIEIAATPIRYKGEQFAQVVARDITESKRDLERAYLMEKRRMTSSFPIKNVVDMQRIYMPANNLSGDFFKIQKINQHVAVGLIGDVSGKGVTAALNISALNILFNDAISLSSDPLKIIKYINGQVIRHFNEEYIAVCCFMFDFDKSELKAAGAGINNLIFIQGNENWEVKEIKGSFLGMFEDSLSEEVIINFNSGDMFFFYTDGMDFVLENEKVKDKILRITSLLDIKKYIKSILIGRKSLDDDSSWMGIKIL